MLVQLLPYAFGCVLALVAAGFSRSRDCVYSALILILGWAATNAAYLANVIGIWPFIDLAIAVFALDQVRAAWTKPEWWKLMFLILCVDQLFLDGAYGLFGVAAYYPYSVASNLTFVMQLMAVGWVGGSNVWSNLLLRIHGLVRMDRIQRTQVEMKRRA